MAPQFPSVQAFFQPESQSPQKLKDTGPAGATGGGFTTEEVENTLRPTNLHSWRPRGTYEEADIATLVPGPCCVTIMGRVVNYYHLETPSKAPHAAKGCWKLVVKDDSGAIVVRLWYHTVDYRIRLGQLVTIWTPHVSNADASSVVAQGATILTSIFPEKDNSCYFMIQEKSDDGSQCKLPLDYCEGKQLPGLMTLKSLAEGGTEVFNAKVLLCVKSIGGRKTFTTKKGKQVEKVDVGVFDDTGDATLELWNSVAVSSCAWRAYETILLFSNPGFKNARRCTLAIETKTHVDVDPYMTDAFWLRKFAQNLTKREHVNPPFPEGVFDFEAARTSELRLLFTLADIDEWARAAPQERFCGWISVLLTELNVTSLYQRNMLFCTECCGLPLFANTVSANCKQCAEGNTLRINPRLVGPLVDETGSIGCGKIIWSDAAWEQLLGRAAVDLAECNGETLRYLEYRLLFLRINLFFGWSEEVGELVVYEVRTF